MNLLLGTVCCAQSVDCLFFLLELITVLTTRIISKPSMPMSFLFFFSSPHQHWQKFFAKPQPSYLTCNRGERFHWCQEYTWTSDLHRQTAGWWRKLIHIFKINAFPHNDTFWCLWETSLLKTLWEKEKLFVMSNFSFSHNVFYLFG